MKSSETDITFLNKLNARDHEAFKQLFREFFQDIAYYSSKILKDTDIAEDIAQEVFIRLWEKENHFENYLALKSYLYLSARNRGRTCPKSYSRRSRRANLGHDCRE